jgi:hypothetical protein
MQTRWIEFLLNYGASANLVVKTGTTCPCMTYRSQNTSFPRYDPEYHRLFPLAEDCLGAGKIAATTTTTAIKAFFHDPAISVYENSMISNFLYKQESIGEFLKYELILNGTCNTSGVFVDLSGYVDDERTVYVVYNSSNYRIKRVLDLRLANSLAAQIVGMIKYA